jgi:hypothetical protein
VTTIPPNQLDDALEQLVSSELIFRRGTPPDAEYTFKHALVQDAAYRHAVECDWRPRAGAPVYDWFTEGFDTPVLHNATSVIGRNLFSADPLILQPSAEISNKPGVKQN